MNKDSKIINAGRSKKWVNKVVNPPIERASTVIFDSVNEMKQATLKRGEQVHFYGRRGTATTFAFQEAMTDIEGGAGCAVYPSGTAAITNAILAFVQTGDHILMVDTAYEPTRDFCDKVLSRIGVDTTYYPPLIGKNIASLIQPNTRLIFLESPGSLTMEVQDVSGIAQVAHQHGCLVMLDNTWAAGVNFQPFEHGVDISVQAATKYIVGHSDVMLGTAVANEKYWPTLRENSYLMGQCTSPDDLYLAMRGMRTLSVRLAQHQANALTIAHWLNSRDEVATILHPAFASCPGHEFFQRDFTGSNGLFSFILSRGDQRAVNALLDGMVHFKMGYSWGGFESLIIANTNLGRIRTATPWPDNKILIRLHVGLEDVNDLIADLEQGFQRLNSSLASTSD